MCVYVYGWIHRTPPSFALTYLLHRRKSLQNPSVQPRTQQLIRHILIRRPSVFAVFRIRDLRNERIAPDAPFGCSLVRWQMVEREALEAIINPIDGGSGTSLEVDSCEVAILPAFGSAPEGPQVGDVAQKAIHVAVVGDVDGLQGQDVGR